MKLGKSQSKTGDGVMKFDCEVFSCFQEENETLFFGGYTELRIKGIMQWAMGLWRHYDKYMEPINALNRIIHGKRLRDQPIWDNRKAQKWMNHIVKDYLHIQLLQMEKVTTPQYVACLLSYQLSSEEHIRLNWNEMKIGYEWMNGIMKTGDNELDIGNLSVLFADSSSITFVVSDGEDLAETEWESVINGLSKVEEMGLSMSIRFELSSDESRQNEMYTMAIGYLEMLNSTWHCRHDGNTLIFSISDATESEKQFEFFRDRIASMITCLNPQKLTEIPESIDIDSDLDTDNDFDLDMGSEEDSDFDVNELLRNFEAIASLGAKFVRHTGKKIKKKPQLRTIKVSFSEDGKPLTLSCGAGSRAIKYKDIWYIAQGFKTPCLIARKDVLDPDKCFSIVGHSEKQLLELEAYTKREAEIWVKGLRKLKNQTDERADQLSEMNKSRLLEYKAKEEKEKKELRTKQLKVVQLQQDLFVMTVEAVYKELTEEGIWEINQTVRDKFNPNTMYESVLKQNIAWRKWQSFVRDQITNYLKGNDMVKSPQVGRSASDDAKETDGALDGVAMFLEHHNLQKYADKLKDSGIHNLEDIMGLEDLEIVQLSVEVSMTVLHKKRFIEAVRNLRNGQYPSEHFENLMEMDKFLRKLGLEQYGKELMRSGVTDLMSLRSLNDEEIMDLADECGMSMLHQNKFIFAQKEINAVMRQQRQARENEGKKSTSQRPDACLVM